MKYHARSKLLSSDDGIWSKRLDCPLNKQWDELQSLDAVGSSRKGFFEERPGQQPDLRRHCPSCKKDVIDISDFDDHQVGALVRVDPSVCVHASQKSAHISFDGTEDRSSWPGPRYSCSENTIEVPLVHTARTVYAINAAAKEGYWPLLRSIEPSTRIREKTLVSQNSDGTINVAHDYRAQPGADAYWRNPYHSPLPFAAYLIPPDLQAGARVYLTDMIEDIVGQRWNQGDSYRQNSAYAVWDGTDLKIEQEAPLSVVG